MNVFLIFVWIWGAMIAMSFWEAAAEGRKSWDKGKIGWKLKIKSFVLLTKYHFSVWVMWLLLITLPFVAFGWDVRLFWIIISAFISGITVIEDFGWYVFNPKVKLKEFWSPFSDYYPWIRFGKKKIIPVGYVLGIIVSITILLLVL